MSDAENVVRRGRGSAVITNDLEPLAMMLAEGFFDDPVMKWCYPDDRRRLDILPRFFRACLDATRHAGGVEIAATGHAAAVWVAPGAHVDNEGLESEISRVSAEYAERVAVMFQLEADAHPVDRPHQYLFLLGVHPRRRGEGLGTALLGPTLADCDRDGIPAYLEASNERNQVLYERHGFEARQEICLPDGPSLWSMWREPRPR